MADPREGGGGAKLDQLCFPPQSSIRMLKHKAQIRERALKQLYSFQGPLKADPGPLPKVSSVLRVRAHTLKLPPPPPQLKSWICPWVTSMGLYFCHPVLMQIGFSRLVQEWCLLHQRIEHPTLPSIPGGVVRWQAGSHQLYGVCVWMTAKHPPPPTPRSRYCKASSRGAYGYDPFWSVYDLIPQ